MVGFERRRQCNRPRRLALDLGPVRRENSGDGGSRALLTQRRYPLVQNTARLLIIDVGGRHGIKCGLKLPELFCGDAVHVGFFG